MGIHRASQTALPETWSTGWPALDAILPGGGYPLSAVTEWLIEQPGRGELSLLLKALAPRLASAEHHRLALLNPPYALNAPALDAAGIARSRVPVIRCEKPGECVWSVEQLAAVSGFVGFVIWGEALDTRALRRLQLASEKAGCPVFVYRDRCEAGQRSPAALRLLLSSCDDRQEIRVLKCRGPAGARLSGLSVARDTPWAWPQPRKPDTMPAGLSAANGSETSVPGSALSGPASGVRLRPMTHAERVTMRAPECGARSQAATGRAPRLDSYTG